MKTVMEETRCHWTRRRVNRKNGNGKGLRKSKNNETRQTKEQRNEKGQKGKEQSAGAQTTSLSPFSPGRPHGVSVPGPIKAPLNAWWDVLKLKAVKCK